VSALRAVGAILGASACFDLEQLAELDLGRIVELAMNLLRGENKIEKWALVELLNLLPRPVMSQAGAWCVPAGRFSYGLAHSRVSSSTEPKIVTRFEQGRTLFVAPR
jgi:hypothetical protein